MEIACSVLALVGVPKINKAIGSRFFYPCLWLNPPQSLVGAIAGFCDVSAAQGTAELSPDDLAGILPGFEAGADAPVLQALIDSGRTTTLCWMQSDGPIESTPAAYLKLHLLSRCLVRPNEVNLEGIFAQLPNVAWTSQGAVDLEVKSMMPF